MALVNHTLNGVFSWYLSTRKCSPAISAALEGHYLPGGDAVANIRLAITDRYKDEASGEYKEMTRRRVTFFRRLAEIVSE